MVIIDDKVFEWANMTENQLLEDIAIMLYQKQKLTFGQAAQTAKMSQAAFQFLLGRNQIPTNYGVADLMDDMTTIQKIKNGSH
jgi:predicted HTH domain antitoxin